MTLKNQNSSMTLRGLEMEVYLGWPQAERAQTQLVSIDINIEFSVPSPACVSDKLEDTYCYQSLIKNLEEKISSRSFHLLEHLGYELYQIIKQSVSANEKVGIHVTKMPPIPNLKAGATFYFGD